MGVSQLVVDSLVLLRQSAGAGPVLDLACGSGRNGIFLVEQGLSVVFADRQQEKLDEIALALGQGAQARYWNVDFEAPGTAPLHNGRFGAVVVFRYLHRPLMPALKDAVQPGGIVIYETFTTGQPRFGRPRNPDFLLRPGELAATFDGWEILHSFEGVTRSDTSDAEQAIAQLVARKPTA